MATKQNIDCPLCKGETIQPCATIYDHHGNSIGLRSEVTWRLEGTTLYQMVSADYITDKDLYYDEDFTPEVKYCIPVWGLSHCPWCRRRLIQSVEENDYKENVYVQNLRKRRKQRPPPTKTRGPRSRNLRLLQRPRLRLHGVLYWVHHYTEFRILKGSPSRVHHLPQGNARPACKRMLRIHV